ncbi:MAG: hypothetical protein ACM31C_13780 [Acidobacteriota bacterium]
MRLHLASICLLLVACSHNALDPGAGSDPGTGTGTLSVNGDARAQSDVANSKVDTDFTTEFSVELSLAGMPVTTGTVTVRSSSGTTTLTFDNTAGQNGRWRGQAANYDEVYELNVISGTDKISAVYVDGPDIHTFTLPTLGASIDPSMATDTKWARAAAAQQAEISFGDQNGLSISDSGTYSIPMYAIPYEKDQTKMDRIRLTRTNSIAPKGAVGGSSFSVSVAQELDVIATACPTCP